MGWCCNLHYYRMLLLMRCGDEINIDEIGKRVEGKRVGLLLVVMERTKEGMEVGESVLL